MSAAALERPSQTGTATRRVVSARLRMLCPVESPCREPFDDLATVFPSRRLGCSASTSLARRRGLGFDAHASATASLIGAGLQSLDAERRRSVLEGWHAYRDHGPRLVGDSGCDIRLGRTGVDGAERVALLAWLPLTERELAVYEGGLFEDAPAHAVALLVRPPTIWSLAEAVAAEQRFPRGRRFTSRRFAAIERHAYGWIRTEHLIRLRQALDRIAAQLPAAGLPIASATVGAGCTLIAEDESRARAVVARQLARYASSALVGACTRESGR